MLILGIESSCDETAAAIVTGDRKILSNIVLSQLEEHRPYGGVVPEIAARSHIEHMDVVIAQAMEEAGVSFSELSAVAATGGPGLIGGVIVGVMAAKAIASVHRKPFIAVNHLEGHALTVRLTEDVPFPYLLLLVSGGHCQFMSVEGIGNYHKLGGTLDDALGEAFDKTAKMLGMPYPGGPQVERRAREGNPKRFAFPRPLHGKPGCNFSFSGLKTAIRTEIEKLRTAGALDEQAKSDICASFQQCVRDIVCEKSEQAVRMFRARHPGGKDFVLAGGVAANMALRADIVQALASYGMTLKAPPMHLCTDNAAMIAWAGLELLREGRTDPLSYEPRARWPLTAA